MAGVYTTPDAIGQQAPNPEGIAGQLEKITTQGETDIAPTTTYATVPPATPEA